MKKSMMPVLGASGNPAAQQQWLCVSQFCFDSSLSPLKNKVRTEKREPGLVLAPLCPWVLGVEPSPLGVLGTCPTTELYPLLCDLELVVLNIHVSRVPACG